MRQPTTGASLCSAVRSQVAANVLEVLGEGRVPLMALRHSGKNCRE